MITPLIETTVRPDWQEIGRQRTAASARLWRGVQVAVVALALGTLVLTFLPGLSPRAEQLRLLLLAATFWPLPLFALLREEGPRRQAMLRTLVALAVVWAAALLVAFSAPIELTAGGWRGAGPLPSWSVAAAPLAVWGLLLRLFRDSPANARRLGVLGGSAFAGLATGAAAGALLGLHFWFTASFIPGWLQPGLPSPAILLWWACALTALQTPAEELLFRGVGYGALEGSGQAEWPGLAFRMLLVNLFLYVIPIGAQRVHPGLWVLTLLYASAMIALSTWLRARLGRLAPSLACNLVFGLLLAGVGIG